MQLNKQSIVQNVVENQIVVLEICVKGGENLKVNDKIIQRECTRMVLDTKEAGTQIEVTVSYTGSTPCHASGAQNPTIQIVCEYFF